MIDYTKIYTFRDPSSARAFRGAIMDHSEASAEVSRGEAIIDHFVKVGHFMGEAMPKDVIWTANAHPLVFSEFVIDLLIENNISGWETYPVKIYDKYFKEIPEKYFGFIICGRANFVDYTRSEIIIKRLGIKDTPHVRGIYFYTDQWDGSDFFMENSDPDDKITMSRYCTERVFKLFKKNKVRNLAFEKVVESDIWYYSLENGATPRLQQILNDLLNKSGNL